MPAKISVKHAAIRLANSRMDIDSNETRNILRASDHRVRMQCKAA